MKKLSTLFMFALLIFLSGCGIVVSEYVTRDNSYNFDPSDKTILFSLVNHDDWILKGNEIFEKKLHSLAANLLRENGFTLTQTKNKSRYLFILTVGSELRREPEHSYTTTEFKDIHQKNGKVVKVPVSQSHVSRGYSYRAVIIFGSCFDVETGKQVFYERTSTIMEGQWKLFELFGSHGYTVEDMYKIPVNKIIQNFLMNFNG